MKKIKMILAALAITGATIVPLSSAEAFWWPFGGWGGPWGGYPYGGYGYPGLWGHLYAYPYVTPVVPQAQTQSQSAE